MFKTMKVTIIQGDSMYMEETFTDYDDQKQIDETDHSTGDTHANGPDAVFKDGGSDHIDSDDEYNNHDTLTYGDNDNECGQHQHNDDGDPWRDARVGVTGYRIDEASYTDGNYGL